MSRVVVRSVRPYRLHAFDRGEISLENLSDGLNLVYGENTAGKSTLARAIGMLFQKGKEKSAVVHGVIDIDGVCTDRSNQDPAYEGAPADPSEYLLDIQGLLQGMSQHRNQIERLLTDGAVEAPKKPRTPQDALKQVQILSKELEEARRSQEGLREKEDRLAELQAQIERDETAGAQLEALANWIKRRNGEIAIGDLLIEIEAIDDAYPGIGLQKEGDIALLEEALRALEDKTTAVIRAEEEVAKSQPSGRLPARQLDDASRIEAHLRHDAIAKASTRLEEARRSLAQAEKTLDSHRSAVLRLLPEAEPRAIEADDLSALTNAALKQDQRRRNESQRQGFALARDKWVEANPESSTPANPSVMDALRDWLRESPTPEGNEPRIPLAILSVAAVVASLMPELAIRVVVAVAGILVAGVLFLQSRKPQAASRRPDLARAAGLAEQASSDQIVERLYSLLRQKAGSEVLANLKTLETTVQVEEEDWKDAAKRLAIKCEDPYAISSVVASIVKLHELEAAVAAWTGETASAEADLETARNDLASVFQLHEFETDRCAPESAFEAFVQWFGRASTLHDAKRALEDQHSKIREILDHAGIPEGELADRKQMLLDRAPSAATLRDLIKQKEDQERDRDQIAIEEKHLCVALAGIDRTTVSDEILEDLLDDLKTRSNRLTNLRLTAQEIHLDLERAGIEKVVTSKEQAFRKALDGLSRQWSQVVDDTAAFYLRASQNERLRTVEAPELVRLANDWLGRFSDRRYELRLCPTPTAELGALAVYDHTRAREQDFLSLSTGTKVHVTIALRLGLIEMNERARSRGELRFPLLADELLAVSDPNASLEIAKALQEIATERQVIVFTNQPDDVALLCQVVEALPVQSIHGPAPTEDKAAAPSSEAPGFTDFDPRHPVWLLAPSALDCILDLLDIPVGVSRLNRIADMDCRRLIERIEKTRLRVQDRFPLLTLEHLDEMSGVTATFRPRLEEAVEKTRGSGTAFLAECRSLKGFRESNYQAIQEWLQVRGYLDDPTHNDIQQLVEEEFAGVPCPDRLKYETANWFLEARRMPVLY